MKRKPATIPSLAAVVLACMAVPSQGATAPSRLGVCQGPGKAAEVHDFQRLPMLPKGGTFAQGLSGAYDGRIREPADLAGHGRPGRAQGDVPPCGHADARARRSRFPVRLQHGRGPFGQGHLFETLYPGDAYVDIVGLNIYDVWWGNPSATPAERWNHILTKPMGVNEFKALAAAHNKPQSYPEWGLSGSAAGPGVPGYAKALPEGRAEGGRPRQDSNLRPSA